LSSIWLDDDDYDDDDDPVVPKHVAAKLTTSLVLLPIYLLTYSMEQSPS
jgi:hypothetical protein